ncbi:MAG TPA: RIO1 family regulatory kinase/ATPase [Candidatus Nanoarchaeia archaeon]|nr:RIO1 family regulatory kinase/ATPase [Candidatus Nanoarchaeia archaeon]
MANSREKYKTEHGVFDAFTSQTLFKLASDGHFEGLQTPISIGKESNVFAARRQDGSFVVVKIYRLENCDFNRMYDYIKSDPRFMGLLKRRRQVIFTWAKREYRNLLLVREARVSAPKPLACKNNVLVEEFIGDDEPAQRLLTATPKKPKEFFALLVGELKKMYSFGLTHGDLSAFNILNFNERPVLIDFSQTTTKENPRFAELFERDVRIVCTYFNKLGLSLKLETVINDITHGNRN